LQSALFVAHHAAVRRLRRVMPGDAVYCFNSARLIGVALSLIAASALAAPSAPSMPTFRIEVHPIPSVDLTTAEALTGKTDGAARTIAGELRLPFSTQARVPAVIFLHGDAGAWPTRRCGSTSSTRSASRCSRWTASARAARSPRCPACRSMGPG
jgi:hypothetical protein